MARGFTAASVAAFAVIGAGGIAHAQVDLISPEAIHGVVDLRLVAANGETSFREGGFGKTRYGGAADGGYQVRAAIPEAALEWRPRLNWEWSAVVDLIAQPGQDQPVDLGQAYVQFKPVPHSSTRFSAKAGYFYPPISLEHDAPVWGVTNTITPSAINSWVGEELKVLGIEASVSHDFGDQRVTLTGALFGFDDTAGTLLTYRGWALHDIQSTPRGEFELPALSAFGAMVQDQDTYSALEIDHRVGFYGRIEWTPAAWLTLDALYYNNNGDKVGVTDDLQWAWKTYFVNAGARVTIDDKTHLMGQVLIGRTLMGFPTANGLFADVTFRSAYGLIARQMGKGAFTGRVDLFDARDNSLVAIDNNDERGWALTAAYRRELSSHADLRFEALHVWSDRPSRAYGGLAPRQAQTVFQSSLRFSF